MLITLACAAMTVIFFIFNQVTEGHWKWGDFTFHWNSAFFTGIYGMWNLYVFALMFLYAPSHKNYGEDQSNGEMHFPAVVIHLHCSTTRDVKVRKKTGKIQKKNPVFSGFFPEVLLHNVYF
uniref:Wntless-like transmembrane domain-containing protein n=1 Tax=Micrurus spixii TaxID=129469 RepID=A0A2D4LTS5_9SAUR